MSSEAAEFVDRMGGALTQAGLPRLPSLVFSALLVDDDGKMTSAELSSALEVSPASISGSYPLPGPARHGATRTRTWQPA